jgi:predicted regulator of Ras-like GTPase activity (Roadblock/LC7/MglB family)
MLRGSHIATAGQRRNARSRWAAIGASIAVTFGAGGLFSASASTSSGERAVFVPIPPCRLLDTRPAPDNVGPRSTPLAPGETFVAATRGTNGNCTLPADAVAVSMNVTIIQPSAASFLSVFPADASRPLAASLNWVGGQAPTPNAIMTRLAADGRIAFYNLAGTVHLAADVNGYYVDHNHDDRYYTKTQIDQRFAAPASGGSRVVLATSSNDLGYPYPALTIGSDGNPVVAFTVGGVGVKVAVCSNRQCTGQPVITVVDGTSTSSAFLSVKIGADGLPVVSYVDTAARRVRVAKCLTSTCTSASTSTIDPGASHFLFDTSIAIGSDGNPIVSYGDNTDKVLKVAKCIDPACTGTPIRTTVDPTPQVGQSTSIAIGKDGLPIISYLDFSLGDLKVAKCSTISCTGSTAITRVDQSGFVGEGSSIAIPDDGLPVISYRDDGSGKLLVAKCGDPACSGPATRTVVTSFVIFSTTSLAIGTNGNPIIAARDQANFDLVVAQCGNPACTGIASVITLDSVGNTGLAPSLAIGGDGLPVIAHFDVDDSTVRITKCGTASCAP